MIRVFINAMFCNGKISHPFLFLVSFLLTSSAVPTNIQNQGLDNFQDKENEDKSEVILDRIARVNNAVMETNEVEINELSDLTLYEGDIIMNNTQYTQLSAHVNPLIKRASVRQQSYLWTSKIIPYVIDSKIPADTIVFIKRALDDYENKTCLTFSRRTREFNWIHFTRQQGCWSHIGRQISGAQNISIGSGCESIGIIQHEVMHALGFFHEQSRPDRNSFVAIFWENILPGQESNFVRYADNVIDNLGLDYDYESVMHYGNRYFSKNGRPTILATPAVEITLGQRSGLSKLDHVKVNVLYDCSFHQLNSWSQWSSYSPCDEYCQKTRQRFCYSEHPGNCDGASPTGIQTGFSKCPDEECYAAVHGHWGAWSRFTACSASCGVGIQRRVRMCNDPYPANSGQPCLGYDVELKQCRIRLCDKGIYDCDFTDPSECTWRQSNLDDFDWTRKSEGTPSRTTGPDWDHTGLIPGVEESYGFFFYIEASGKPFGYRARFWSDIIQESVPSDINLCLSFYYHMFGEGIGELNVYLVLLHGEKILMWKKSGNQGRTWHHGIVSLASSRHQIVFEGVRGESYTGDIAIDDISVLSCETKTSPSTNVKQSETIHPPFSPSFTSTKRLGTIRLATSSLITSYNPFITRNILTSLTQILTSTLTSNHLSNPSRIPPGYSSKEKTMISSQISSNFFYSSNLFSILVSSKVNLDQTSDIRQITEHTTKNRQKHSTKIHVTSDAQSTGIVTQNMISETLDSSFKQDSSLKYKTILSNVPSEISLKEEIAPTITSYSSLVVPSKIHVSTLTLTTTKTTGHVTMQTSVQRLPSTRKMTRDTLERQNLSTDERISKVVLPTSSGRIGIKSLQRIIESRLSASQASKFSGSGQTIDVGIGSGCDVGLSEE